jgi:hypothetical protein
MTDKNKPLLPQLIDMAAIETPQERWARQAEENDRRAFRRILDREMPPINTRRGVEYYTGEYYG